MTVSLCSLKLKLSTLAGAHSSLSPLAGMLYAVRVSTPSSPFLRFGAREGSAESGVSG